MKGPFLMFGELMSECWLEELNESLLDCLSVKVIVGDEKKMTLMGKQPDFIPFEAACRQVMKSNRTMARSAKITRFSTSETNSLIFQE